jgi:hypothetical protein
MAACQTRAIVLTKSNRILTCVNNNAQLLQMIMFLRAESKCFVLIILDIPQ